MHKKCPSLYPQTCDLSLPVTKGMLQRWQRTWMGWSPNITQVGKEETWPQQQRSERPWPSYLWSFFFLLLSLCSVGERVVLFGVFVVLEFELRSSCLLGKHNTTWVSPPDSLALVILEVESCFFPGWPGLLSSYFFPLLGRQVHATTASFFPLR
jgi:hypothetical protein